MKKKNLLEGLIFDYLELECYDEKTMQRIITQYEISNIWFITNLRILPFFSKHDKKKTNIETIYKIEKKSNKGLCYRLIFPGVSCHNLLDLLVIYLGTK